MQELALTPGTIAVLLVVVALVVLSIRRMLRRGLCDCGDHCGDGGCSGCSGCSGCREGEVKTCPACPEIKI